MNYTNKYNLPKMVTNAIEHQERQYSKSGDFSATELLSPVYQKYLFLKNKDKITVDYSSYTSMLLGSAFHKVLEDANPGRFTEMELTAVLPNGIKISGRVDYYDQTTKAIIDYKTTRSWSIGNESIVKNWEKQLNIYAYLCYKNDIEVDNIKIIGLIKDWKYAFREMESKPDTEIVEIQLDIYDFSETEAMLLELSEKHAYAKESKPPICSPEERWQDEDRYGVQNIAKNKVIKICYTKSDAEKAKSAYKKPDDYQVVIIPAEPRRCMSADFCKVRDFCEFYYELQKEQQKKEIKRS